MTKVKKRYIVAQLETNRGCYELISVDKWICHYDTLEQAEARILELIDEYNYSYEYIIITSYVKDSEDS